MQLTLENWGKLLKDLKSLEGVKTEELEQLVQKLLTLQRQATIGEKDKEFSSWLEYIRAEYNKDKSDVDLNDLLKKRIAEYSPSPESNTERYECEMCGKPATQYVFVEGEVVMRTCPNHSPSTI